MKLGPVTKLDKRDKTPKKKKKKKTKKKKKKKDDDVMSETCDVIVIFQMYGQFRAIRKPDSGRVVCKT